MFMKGKDKIDQLDQIGADHEILIGEMTRQTGQLIIQTKIGWVLAGASVVMAFLAFVLVVRISI